MFEIERYTDAQAGEWNAFVRSSKNGTFLFGRGYMDYLRMLGDILNAMKEDNLIKAKGRTWHER